jgi:hypothetical protein
MKSVKMTKIKVLLIKKGFKFKFKTVAISAALIILLATAISTLIYFGLYFGGMSNSWI